MCLTCLGLCRDRRRALLYLSLGYILSNFNVAWSYNNMLTEDFSEFVVDEAA